MVSFYQWSHKWDMYIPESFPVYLGHRMKWQIVFVVFMEIDVY